MQEGVQGLQMSSARKSFKERGLYVIRRLTGKIHKLVSKEQWSVVRRKKQSMSVSHMKLERRLTYNGYPPEQEN